MNQFLSSRRVRSVKVTSERWQRRAVFVLGGAVIGVSSLDTRTAGRDKAGARLHKPNISTFYATKCSTLNEAARGLLRVNHVTLAVKPVTSGLHLTPDVSPRRKDRRYVLQAEVKRHASPVRR